MKQLFLSFKEQYGVTIVVSSFYKRNNDDPGKKKEAGQRILGSEILIFY